MQTRRRKATTETLCESSLTSATTPPFLPAPVCALPWLPTLTLPPTPTPQPLPTCHRPFSQQQGLCRVSLSPGDYNVTVDDGTALSSLHRIMAPLSWWPAAALPFSVTPPPGRSPHLGGTALDLSSLNNVELVGAPGVSLLMDNRANLLVAGACSNMTISGTHSRSRGNGGMVGEVKKRAGQATRALCVRRGAA